MRENAAHDQSVDILLVVPLSEEFDTFRALFDFHKPVFRGGNPRSYYLNPSVCTDPTAITSNEYSIAAMCLDKMGNTNSGVAVTNALHDLNPAYVFMFGVAGGLAKEANLTDVIVAESIWYYALGKRFTDWRNTKSKPLRQVRLLLSTLRQPHYDVEMRPESVRIDPMLIGRLRAYQRSIVDEKQYNVLFGPFAVGEEVIKSEEFNEELRKKLTRKLVGVEMESWGAAIAVYDRVSSTKFVTIRGVSDKADAAKSDNPRPQALANAADFMLGFIKSGLLPKEQRTSKQNSKYIAIHHMSQYRRPAITQAVNTYLTRLQTFDVEELTIDQIKWFVDGSWSRPKKPSTNKFKCLPRSKNYFSSTQKAQLGYFSLAHIPLMFQLGYEINRRPVEVFATAYNDAPWIDLPITSPHPNIIVEGEPKERNDEHGDVVLLMSISYPVISSEPLEICGNPLAYVHIRSENPLPGIVDSYEVLDLYTELFRKFLNTIHSKLPNTHRIHVFYAGPPTLALRCGQQINRNIDPEIIIYNHSKRDNPIYRWGINLQTQEVIERKVNNHNHV